MTEIQLKQKIKINGKIKLLTGLHIGGSSSTLDIGSLDGPVVKKGNGEPYIPGSSLKGKMRSLMEMANLPRIIQEKKHKDGVCQCGTCNICKLFGTAAEESKEPGRLIVRDCDLVPESMFKDLEKKEHNEKFEKLDLTYTEGKWENTIDRIKSSASPRQIERVPAGVQFNFEFVFNVYENDRELLDDLVKAMKLLEDDYLGGSGTRGYGKIKFIDMKVVRKRVEDYSTEKTEEFEDIKTLEDLRERAKELL